MRRTLAALTATVACVAAPLAAVSATAATSGSASTTDASSTGGTTSGPTLQEPSKSGADGKCAFVAGIQVTVNRTSPLPLETVPFTFQFAQPIARSASLQEYRGNHWVRLGTVRSMKDTGIGTSTVKANDTYRPTRIFRLVANKARVRTLTYPAARSAAFEVSSVPQSMTAQLTDNGTSGTVAVTTSPARDRRSMTLQMRQGDRWIRAAAAKSDASGAATLTTPTFTRGPVIMRVRVSGSSGSRLMYSPVMIGGVLPADQADRDGDRLDAAGEAAAGTSATNPDSDADGYLDGDEVRAGIDPTDSDSDDDGLSDGAEQLIRSKPHLADTDGDTINDLVEVQRGLAPRIKDRDRDADTLLDREETFLDTNANAADTDKDGATDPVELAAGTDPTTPDSDSDGLTDAAETTGGTDPLSDDSDCDGWLDGEELTNSTDPNNAADPGTRPSDEPYEEPTDNPTTGPTGEPTTGPTTEPTTDPTTSPSGEPTSGPTTGPSESNGDRDHDGLLDNEEPFYKTDPDKFDTDGDGIGDGDEVHTGTNPVVAEKDTDGDGRYDYKDWAKIAVNDNGGCAIRVAGGLWCWGANTFGLVGDSSGRYQNSPVRIQGESHWVDVDVNRHACGIQVDGTLWCWGYNNNGQVGNGTKDNVTSPVKIGTATDWREVATYAYSTCAIKTNGTLWCWGSNEYGETGLGLGQEPVTVPTAVGGTTSPSNGWLSLARGDAQTVCGIRSDYSLWCWGRNDREQVGTTSGTDLPNAVTTPKRVLVPSVNSNNFSPVADVAVSTARTCAVGKPEYIVWCWGADFSASGWRNAPASDKARREFPGSKVVDIALGEETACVRQLIDADHGYRLGCWGSNVAHAKGDGTAEGSFSASTSSATNGQLDAVGGYTAVDATSYGFCAIRTGSARCWGSNSLGQNGVGYRSQWIADRNQLLDETGIPN